MKFSRSLHLIIYSKPNLMLTIKQIFLLVLDEIC